MFRSLNLGVFLGVILNGFGSFCMAEVTISVAAREGFLCREEFCFTSEQSQGGAQEVPVTLFAPIN